MKRRIVVGIFFVMVAGLMSTPCMGQSDTDNNSGECMSPSTLLSLLHLPFGEAFDRLDSMGFNLGDLGDLSDTIYDTIDYFTIAYQRSIFFNRNNKGCYVLFMESLDGLSNYIEYSLTPRGTCNISAEFNSRNYVYNKERSSYSGTIPINGQIEKFEIVVRQDYSLWMQCKRTDDIPEFVGRRRDSAKTVINNATTRAMKMADAEQFGAAYAILDSLRGSYPPMDIVLDQCRERITQQREQMYEYRLSGAVELMEYSTAVMLCDTILSINPKNEKVRHTQELLYAQLGQKSQHFHLLRPENFDSIQAQLGRIANTYIRRHVSTDYQQMKLDFRIYTNKTNESGGQIELTRDVVSRRTMQQEKESQEMLQRAVDNVATSPLIQPVVENGIYVITQDDLSADVRWNYSTIVLNGDEAKGEGLLCKYVDSVERMFFYHKRPSKTELNADGSVKMVTVHALPTRRVYTFCITQKESYGQTYSDISLIDFETARGNSWMPSLLVPGLGTYLQDARGDVVSRALPFYLFLGISAGGFIYHNQKGGEVEADATWAQQNVGKIVGFCAASVSTAIYFTDLFEAIGNCFKNTKRSKALRKRLKEGDITLQLQDVPIKLQQ